MKLTNTVLDIYRDPRTNRPIDPFNVSNGSDKSFENNGLVSESAENPYFDRDCPTNLAMLDIWCENINKDISSVTTSGNIFMLTYVSNSFRKCLLWESPLYTGELEAFIHLTDPYIAQEVAPEIEYNVMWGEPKASCNRRGLPWAGQNLQVWSNFAPVISLGGI
jgi:hypothetical protein